MKIEDKKDLYKFLIVLAGVAIVIGSQFLPALTIDPKLLSLLGIGVLLTYRYLKPLILRHTGLTEAELDDIEDNIGDLAGAPETPPS